MAASKFHFQLYRRLLCKFWQIGKTNANEHFPGAKPGYFAFGHETPEQHRVLAGAGLALMFDAIKPLGIQLATMPVGAPCPGATAGANFQLAYRASFLLPHRRSAWFRFGERLDEIADAADDVRGDERTREMLDKVALSLRRIVAFSSL